MPPVSRRGLMGDDRPSRYVEGDVVVYRASALGSCPKVLVAIGLGMTPEPFPAWLLERFRQGVEGEPVVLERLRARGWRLRSQQRTLEVRIGSGLLVRGHVDATGEKPVSTGDGTGDDRERLVEVKCVTQGYADDILRQIPPLYHWQCAAYGRGLGMPVTLVLGVKDEDGQVDEVIEKDIEVAGMAAVKLRVMAIERHIAEGTWPKCSYRQWPCPFPELCDDDLPEPTENWELENKLRESLVGVHVRH